MKIATVSLDQKWEDKEANLLQCEKYIQQASKEKADLIIFPEMSLTGFTNNLELAENINDSWSMKSFQYLSKKYNVAIDFGVIIKNKNKALNKLIFLDKNGNILKNYTKIHPFSFAKEDEYFNAGNEPIIVEFMKHKIGLSICYDLRFPELSSAYSKECDIIVNIANWPKKRVEHWDTLLKARAIENQLFIVGVNRIGIDGNGLVYTESSKIFNANGEETQPISKLSEMKIFEIDKQWTKEFRNGFNTLVDRKYRLYKRFLKC